MRPGPFLLAFVLSGVLPPAWAAPAGTVERHVRATGLAPVYGGDETRAFEEARRAALREAVEQGVGVLVSATTRVSNYAIIEDRILSATRGHVRSYEVVERGRRAADTYGVTVDAVVDLGRLHEDLDALELAAVAAGAPRVLIVADLVDGALEAGTPAEAALAGSALRAELSGLDAALEMAVATSLPEDGMIDAEILVRARVQVQDTRAPVPFAGRSVAQTGLRTAAAHVDVAVRWTDEATPFGRVQGEGRGAGGSSAQARARAVTQAVDQAGESLRGALSEDLRRRAYSTRTTQIVVEGAGPADAARALVEDLRAGLAPLESLQPRRIEPGRVVYEARARAGGFDFARQLSGRGLPGRRVEILQVSENRLRLSVGPAADPVAEGRP